MASGRTGSVGDRRAYPHLSQKDHVGPFSLHQPSDPNRREVIEAVAYQLLPFARRSRAMNRIHVPLAPFDPTAGTVVFAPERDEEGYWVGAPGVLHDGKRFWLS